MADNSRTSKIPRLIRNSTPPKRSPNPPSRIPKLIRNWTPLKRSEPEPTPKTTKKVSSRVEPSPKPALPVPVVDEKTCPICMDTISEIKLSQRALMATQCGHIFCSPCLKKLSKDYLVEKRQRTFRFMVTAVQCPTCRQICRLESCIPIYLWFRITHLFINSLRSTIQRK